MVQFHFLQKKFYGVFIPVFIFLLSFVGLVIFPLLTKASLTVPLVMSGTYIGDGKDNRAITGLGFQPDVVFLDGNNASNASSVMRISSMSGDNAKLLDTSVNTFGPNLIRSLDNDGFTVSNNSNVNANNVVYYWTAFKAAPGSMAVGSYGGNGQNNATVSGLGFQPDYLIVLPGNSSAWAIEASTAMPPGIAFAFNGDNGFSGRINSLSSPTNGFTLGTSSSTNSSGVTYYYVAWAKVAGRMNVGSYTGNGGDTSINGLSFQPDFVTIKGNLFSNGVWRNSSMSGDFSLDIPSQGNPTNGVVKGFQNDGFQIGTSSRVNNANNIYYYAAFLRSVPPTFTQTAYRFFANNDAMDVGSPLVSVNTPGDLGALGQAFRVRMLMKTGNDQLVSNGETFKLQFAGKGVGTCASPSGGTPSVYTDVTNSSVIAFQDNPTAMDGTALTPNASDPTNSGDTVVAENYEETNNFTNSSAIANGQDGEWDFSLIDHGAPYHTTYCLRIVKSDGTALDGYNIYPEITSYNDVTPPTVQNVSASTADGVYSSGMNISLQMTWSEPVMVTGTPQLILATGSAGTSVDYAGGSGSNTLIFSYTVAPGQNSSDLDYFSSSALSLNGGAIKDLAGNDAVLTLASPGSATSLGANKNIVIDTTAPSVVNVTALTADGTYSVGSTISIQVVWSEIVNASGTPELTLATGASNAVATYQSGSGTNSLTFLYTIVAGENSADLEYANTSALSLNGGTIKDIVGNSALLLLPVPGDSGSLSHNKDLVVQTFTPNVGSNISNGGGGSGQNPVGIVTPSPVIILPPPSSPPSKNELPVPSAPAAADDHFSDHPVLPPTQPTHETDTKKIEKEITPENEPAVPSFPQEVFPEEMENNSLESLPSVPKNRKIKNEIPIAFFPKTQNDRDLGTVSPTSPHSVSQPIEPRGLFDISTQSLASRSSSANLLAFYFFLGGVGLMIFYSGYKMFRRRKIEKVNKLQNLP